MRALVVAMQQWSISPEEISRYDQSHREIDTASSGFVSGAQARQMFTRSNLQQADLRQIWQLSDVRGTGTWSIGVPCGHAPDPSQPAQLSKMPLPSRPGTRTTAGSGVSSLPAL